LLLSTKIQENLLISQFKVGILLKRGKMQILKYTRRTAQNHLPVRETKDNKTRGGKCLIIAGSKGMYGAAILTCLAAARSGSGYTHLLTSGKFPIDRHPDFLILHGRPRFSDFQSVAIGPGYKSPNQIKSYLKLMLKQKVKHAVLDAEAITALAKTKQKLLKSWIITPHEGELSRILKVPSRTIKKNRLKYILIAQKKLGCVVLLKGHRTLVTDGKSTWEIQSGNPALAKAGTGDVLTGMIAGFLSQGLDSLNAATLAAYIHGMIADQWVKSKNDVLSLLASDIVNSIPKTLTHLR
jgi:ADP-dependent NAD(P)H-hydrate dehydratase